MEKTETYLSGLFALKGRVALVAGGASGIGRQIALALARAGASVTVVARSKDRLEETVQTIASEGGSADALVADLATLEGIDKVVGTVPGMFGDPDILVNSAAVNMRKNMRDITPEDWAFTLDVNLRGPFFLSRALAKGMAGKGRGSILNIASLQAFRAGLGDVSYGASKGGVLQLTRVMAKELAPHVTVNAIVPGFFPTELTKTVFADGDLVRRLGESTLLGRNGRLEDVEGVAVFLCSEAARYITGAAIPLEGGFLAR